MPIVFDYDNSDAHISHLLNEVKQHIEVPYEILDASNDEAFRSAARALAEPLRSKILHTLNYIAFNSQVNNVYRESL